MLHGTEGTLQAYLDGELAPEEGAALLRHLNTCSPCAAELEALRAAGERFSTALERFDRRPPIAAAYTAVLRRSDRRDGVATQPAKNSRRRAGFLRSSTRAGGSAEQARKGRTRARPFSGAKTGADGGSISRTAVTPRIARRAVLRAAALVVFFATAAAAALPESPIRRWAVTAWTEVADRLDGTATDPPPTVARGADAAATPEATDTAPAGMSILPSGDRVRIMLERPAPNARVRVQLVDGPRAAVYVVGGGMPEFRTGPDRIQVIGAGAGEIRIELPRALPHAAVAVDGRLYVVKEAGALRVLAPTPDTAGAEVLFHLP